MLVEIFESREKGMLMKRYTVIQKKTRFVELSRYFQSCGLAFLTFRNVDETIYSHSHTVIHHYLVL